MKEDLSLSQIEIINSKNQKMSVVRLLLCFLLLYSCSTLIHGQNNAIVFYENFQNTPLPEVLNTLRNKYDIKLAFDDKAVKPIVITQDITGLGLNEAIKKILSNTNLTYQVVDADKVLIRKEFQLRTDKVDEGFEISGRIIDYKSGEGLSYATISTTDGKYGTIADENGAFSLRVASENEPLKVQYLGYESQQINGNGNAKDMVVKMSPKAHEIASVIIMEKLPVVRLNQDDGSTSFNINQLEQLPSFVGGKDIMRNLQLLPGIAAHDDLSAELRIRGGDGSENMVMLDGITLYKVDHYFGIFSAINPNYVEEAKLYKNNFPVEYGGRTSGIIELNSAPLSNRQIHGGLEINLLTSNAYLQLPLAKGMGVMLSGRITNTDVADTKLFGLLKQEEQRPARPNAPDANAPREVQAIEPNFKFNDFNIKWEWQPTRRTKLSANFFRGFDNYDYNFNLQYNRRFSNFLVRTTETYSEDQAWKNMGASFRIDQQWNDRFRSHINLNSSMYETVNDIQSTNVDFSTEQNRIVRVREIDNLTSNEIQGWEANWKNELQLNTLQKLSFGYHLVHNEVAFDFIVNDRNILNGSNHGTQHSLYLQYDYGASDRFKASLGLRGTYYSLTNQSYFSPRLFLSYQLDDYWKIKGSYNRYFQFLREAYHENRFGRTIEFWTLSDDNRFPVSRSNQFMAGFNFLDQVFEFDVEFYRKNTSGIVENALLISNIDNVRDTDFKLFEGDRLTYGMDLILKKSVGNYTGWLAYTLSKTTVSFSEINNGAAIPAPDDRRHQLSLVNQYRWKKWDFSMTYVFSSGRPYTDVIVVRQSQDRNGNDRTTLAPKDRLRNLEDYHRVDIGFNYNFSMWGTKAKIGGSVFNLLNRRNIKFRQYIYSFSNQLQLNSAIGTELQLLDITPNLTFSIEF